MTEFYFYPEWVRVAASMAAACGVILQAVSFVFGFHRYRRTENCRWLEDLLQALVLLQAFLLVYLIAQVQQNANDGFCLPSNCRLLRNTLFFLTGLSAAAASVGCRQWFPMLTVPAAALTLPLAERLSGAWFPLLYGTAVLFYSLRAVHLILLYWREIRSGLSAYSVKAAIDALHTGILFCRPDGSVLLVNDRMKRLMVTITGTVQRSGKYFYEECLLSGNGVEACERAEIGGCPVYILPDQTVWMFAKTEIGSRRKAYVQLSASDVTERWRMMEELRQQDEALRERSEKLKKTIANIQLVCREEEAIRMKSRFHDVLGQQVALLLRTLREGREADETLLAAFADGLPQELKSPSASNSVQQKMETLCRVMDGIGVTLHIEGALPESEDAASLCADIAMEASTNSVQHGFATEVFLFMKQTESAFLLRISDNGIPPESEISEGGGISGMRRRLRPFRGTLEVQTKPQFILLVSIPEGGKG